MGIYLLIVLNSYLFVFHMLVNMEYDVIMSYLFVFLKLVNMDYGVIMSMVINPVSCFISRYPKEGPHLFWIFAFYHKNFK